MCLKALWQKGLRNRATASSPVIRTIYAEYRIKTRYSAFFVPFLHKECISTIAYGAFLGLIWD